MTPRSARAKLTDEGGPNVLRVYGRDDRQGMMGGDYVAKHCLAASIVFGCADSMI